MKDRYNKKILLSIYYNENEYGLKDKDIKLLKSTVNSKEFIFYSITRNVWQFLWRHLYFMCSSFLCLFYLKGNILPTDTLLWIYVLNFFIYHISNTSNSRRNFFKGFLNHLTLLALAMYWGMVHHRKRKQWH